MSPTHDISEPWPFRRLNDPMTISGLENITSDEESHDFYGIYETHVQLLPSKIIIPASDPIRRITLIFGPDSELVVSKILDALNDEVTSNIKIAKIADEIYDGLVLGSRGPVNRVAYLDKMVGLEQAGLDLRDVLRASGCYVQNRWMPYLYETILSDYSLLLVLPRSLEEFHDNLCSRDYW
jgi:hypothetical protein